jgi:hypothetical protein
LGFVQLNNVTAILVRKKKDPALNPLLITILFAVIMQEQNVQDLWREGRENDEVKWEKLRLRIKEEEDALHRRGWFGANFFNWSDRQCAADGGEAWASLNEPLTPQQPYIPLDTNTPEVATVGTSMPVAQLEVCRAFCNFLR